MTARDFYFSSTKTMPKKFTASLVKTHRTKFQMRENSTKLVSKEKKYSTKDILKI